MERNTGDERKELLEAEGHVWKYMLNHVTSMSLRCAIQLGIPDIIFQQQGKPITLSGLMKALGTPPTRSDHLYRLMRILVNAGFFAIRKPLEPEEEEGYVLTLSSELLSKSHATSLAPLFLMLTDPVVLTPFHYFSALFQGTGPTPIEAAYGMSLYDYCAKHTDYNKVFNDGMASDSKFVMSILVNNYKMLFEGARSLVDVAGGTGTTAMAISEEFPSMQITVLDLPHVISNSKGNPNMKFVAGDMFKSIPSADIAFLKCVLLDWADEECVKILKRCKEAIPSKEAKGKVIIIDVVVDQVLKDRFELSESELCFDIVMMTIVNGRQRTESEWKKLIQEAGFTSCKITPALGLRSIIEVFP